MSYVIRIACVVAVLTVAFSPRSVLAWGRAGHEIVAEIADRELTDEAREVVRQLLNGRSMAVASGFADEVRRKRPETRSWHYVRIPLRAMGFNRGIDCPEDDCLIGALERQLSILADADHPKRERADALRFVIHLVADLHQPLHIGDDGDRSGREVAVRWFGRDSNLHKVWDTDILVTSGRSTTELAAELARVARDTPELEKRSLRSGTLIDWANEAHVLAGSVAYKLPASRELEERYYDRASTVVALQLVRAGLRLGRVLNERLSPQPQPD